MTGARTRFGLPVVVIAAVLCAGLIGVWAVNRPSTDAPSELARAGIPVSAEDTALDDPELDEERHEQAEGVDERVEAWEKAGARRLARPGNAPISRRAAPPRRRHRLGRRGPDRPIVDDWEPAIAADPHAPTSTCSRPATAPTSRVRATAPRRTSRSRSARTAA